MKTLVYCIHLNLTSLHKKYDNIQCSNCRVSYRNTSSAVTRQTEISRIINPSCSVDSIY